MAQNLVIPESLGLPHAGSRAPTNVEGLISDGRYRLQKTVALPTGSRPQELSQLITAYAFNEDRIKSETAVKKYQRPAVTAIQPRAYVLSIGIDQANSNIGSIRSLFDHLYSIIISIRRSLDE